LFTHSSFLFWSYSFYLELGFPFGLNFNQLKHEILTHLFSFFFLIKNTATAQSSFGTLEGKLTDKETGEGLIAATITLYKTGETTPIAGASTDINGHYSIDSILVGVYDVEFSYVDYKTVILQKIEIKTNNEMVIIGKLEEEGDTYIGCSLEIHTFYIPLISQDDFGTGRVYTSGDIQNMPIKQ
jgi:hypothetical protein